MLVGVAFSWGGGVPDRRTDRPSFPNKKLAGEEGFPSRRLSIANMKLISNGFSEIFFSPSLLFASIYGTYTFGKSSQLR